MKAKLGTYALLLQSKLNKTIQIGRWGQLNISPGFYIYVGSAFGPGGITARVSRHCRAQKSKRWHIDYLREYSIPLLAWYIDKSEPLEHQWANKLAKMQGSNLIKGFGCTDCQCKSHLFFTPTKPEDSDFSAVVGSAVNTWLCGNDN